MVGCTTWWSKLSAVSKMSLTFLPDKQLWTYEQFKSTLYNQLLASLITKVAFSEHHILAKRHAQSCTSASHVFHCRMPSAIEWGKNTVRSRWWWCVCAPGPWVPVRPRGPPMSQDPSYCSGHKYIGYKYTKMQFYANTLKHQQCQRICFIIFLGDLFLIHILSRYSVKSSHSARALVLD